MWVALLALLPKLQWLYSGLYSGLSAVGTAVLGLAAKFSVNKAEVVFSIFGWKPVQLCWPPGSCVAPGGVVLPPWGLSWVLSWFASAVSPFGLVKFGPDLRVWAMKKFDDYAGVAVRVKVRVRVGD